MDKLKDKNAIIKEDNKLKVRELEEFYVSGTVKQLEKTLEQLKEQKVNEMIEFAKTHEKPIYNKDGEIVDYYVQTNPIVVSTYFFRSINPISNKIPTYNAEKLGILYEYYLYLIAEVNDKIGNFPSSLTTFCKLAGITTQTLRDWKNSADLDMRIVVSKIYDEIGDENLTMSQMGMMREKSTIFKLKSQHEMVEKVQPNVNISYKEVVNTDRLNSNLEKYKALIDKKEN